MPCLNSSIGCISVAGKRIKNNNANITHNIATPASHHIAWVASCSNVELLLRIEDMFRSIISYRSLRMDRMSDMLTVSVRAAIFR